MKYSKGMTFEQFLYSNYGVNTTQAQRREAIAKFSSFERQNKTLFETGATSHAVNDLILFTDNTRELAELRNNIYKEWADKNSHPIQQNFNTLYNIAAGKYLEEIKTDNEHIMYMHKDEAKEYRQIYAARFENWKKEHGYK